MAEARTPRTTENDSNHPGLLSRAGLGLCIGMLLIFSGCSQTQPKAVTVTQDPCEPAPNAPTLESIQQENQRLREQVNSLANLPEGIGVRDLYHVVKVQLTRFTGLYDEDKDGQIDQLCVYLRPMDADGDVVKAAGHVTVQLWDLSGQNAGALLSEWQVSAADLREQWFSSLMTVNYRLRFPLQAQWADPALSLTVRTLFKDYLTGLEHTSQRPVKARP